MKIFISSLITGLEDVRAAVREALALLLRDGVRGALRATLAA